MKSIKKYTFDEYYERYEKAKSKHEEWDSLMNEAYSFVFPSKNLYANYLDVNQGEKKNVEVYNSVQHIAGRALQSKMMATVTPSNEMFTRLILNKRLDLAIREEKNKKLLKQTELIFSYLDNSSFNLVAHEYWADIVIGTGAIKVVPGHNKPLAFYNVSPRYLYLDESPNGLIENVYVDIVKVRLDQIKQLYPRANIPDEMEKFASQNSNHRFDLIECVIYNPEATDSNQYIYSVLYKSTKSILIEEHIESSPYIVGRWSKVDNEVMGRGPGIYSLPTVRTLNSLIKYELMGAHMRIQPPLMTLDSSVNVNTLRILPNSIINFKSTNVDGRFPLEQLNLSTDHQYRNILVDYLTNQIHDIFFYEPLGRIGEIPTKTATEMSIREQMASEQIGPVVDRQIYEFVTPLMKRVIYLLDKQNLLDPELKGMNLEDRLIELDFESPLSGSRRLKAVDTFFKAYSMNQQIFGPQLAPATLRIDKVAPYIYEQFGVDPEITKTSEEIAQNMENMEQQQQQAMQAQALNPQTNEGVQPQL